jgi:hypothetical protein
MTTSDPQADRRDDDSREHRGLGQRLRDAVLGEPADPQHDAPADREAGYADPDRGGAGHADPQHDDTAARVDPARDDPARVDPARDDPGRDDSGRDYAPYEEAMREHTSGGAGPSEHVAADRVPDAGLHDDRVRAGYADSTAGDHVDTVRHDTGHTAGADAAGGVSSGDFVTGSYDPDRDAGYDPQAAGTAMTGTEAGDAPAATRDPDTRDYEPSHDTGYVDEGRAEADRTTGRHDADYDTGRVDTGPTDADRVSTERVGDPERDTAHAAGLGTAGAVAAGGAAAGGLAATRHRENDPDTHRDTDRDTGGTRFSEVDDTATVDGTATGRSTRDTTGAGDGTGGDTATDRRAEAVADEGSEGRRERLVPADRAQDYGSRWDALKGDFVDEPRRAVRQADELVGELLDEIQQLFAHQRRDLEQGLDHDQASTEDLRLALRRYRSFFDRLLSF